MLTNALVSPGRPLPIVATVSVPSPYEDVVRVAPCEAQGTPDLVRALYDHAESPKAWLEVEAVPWGALPFAGTMATDILISVEE